MSWNWQDSKIWPVLINKAHVALACLCQSAIFFWHWKTGKDLGPSVGQTVNWFYMFLAGHFGASQVWPDKPDQTGAAQ